MFPYLFVCWSLDYDEKAEDAVDYEDIEEQYEGPEVQAATEEDFLLPRKDYFSKDISISTLGNTNSVYDDENYDEDDDVEEKHGAVEHNEVKAILSAGFTGNHCFFPLMSSSGSNVV